MSVSLKTEKQNTLSFLDVEIIRVQGKLTTTVYKKLFLVTYIVTLKGFLNSVDKFGMVYMV